MVQKLTVNRQTYFEVHSLLVDLDLLTDNSPEKAKQKLNR